MLHTSSRPLASFFNEAGAEVEQLEATADVSKQMAATAGSGKALGSGSVEDRFAQLEAGT